MFPSPMNSTRSCTTAHVLDAMQPAWRHIVLNIVLEKHSLFNTMHLVSKLSQGSRDNRPLQEQQEFSFH